VTAYVIAESHQADNLEAQAYRRLAAASIAQYGGRYLVRGALPDVLEGSWPAADRMVVIEFPSLEQAKRWYMSSEYTQARSTHSGTTGRRVLFVPGIDEQPI
jgi:uncharacterized protein (DUF1330 family)